jgi:hypothetical protein
MSKTNLINFFNQVAKEPDRLDDISTPNEVGVEIAKESLISLGLELGYDFNNEDLEELPEMSGEDWEGKNMFICNSVMITSSAMPRTYLIPK